MLVRCRNVAYATLEQPSPPRLAVRLGGLPHRRCLLLESLDLSSAKCPSASGDDPACEAHRRVESRPRAFATFAEGSCCSRTFSDPGGRDSGVRGWRSTKTMRDLLPR